MSVKKALILTTDGVIKTFNQNNKWVDTSLVKESLTDQDFIDQGFDFSLLSSSLNTIFVNYIDNGVLDSTGTDTRHMYLTEDLDKSLNVLDYDLVDDGDSKYRMKLTIPNYVPKDQLPAGYTALVYDDDAAYAPEILNTSFSASSTHDQSIEMTITAQYLYNKKLKYRLTIGDYVSSWSSEYDSGDINVTILPSYLKVGSNSITIELVDSLDSSKITTTTLTDAITLSDAVPAVNIISADSDAFYLHFIVNDADLGDQLKYKLTMSNSKGQNVIQDWTGFMPNPLDVKYQINSNDIDVNTTNIITIEFQDNFGKGSSSTYTFTGEYKNILFMDENGAYYTTDKGVILKLLNFGKIYSGRSSDIRKVSLINNNPFDVSNIVITKTQTSALEGSYIELAKVNNPFTPLDELDFGDQVLKYKESINFYVRVRADALVIGNCNFDIDAIAIQATA